MAKPNYAFAKRQRDLAKKQKKEEKKLRKAGPATDGAEGAEGAEGATDEAGTDGADGQIRPGDMPVEQVPQASKAIAGAGGQSGAA